MRAMTSEDIFARWEVVREVWAAWTAFWGAVCRALRFGRANQKTLDAVPSTRLAGRASANANARVVRVVNLGGALGSEACACVRRALEVNGAETTTASEDEDEDAATTMTRDALERTEEDDVPYVFVVETAEFDEPAREAREAIKMILKRAANDSSPPPPSRRFAVVMIGDCDIIGERAAYRCNQNVVDDCNRCGIAVETALRRGLGWRRVGDACKLDRSKADDDAWARRECVAVDAWARDVVKELIRD